MMALENSGQWLLSCYGPFKEKSVFPGFEDYSFEEIRFGFYDALKNGTIEHYVSIICSQFCSLLYNCMNWYTIQYFFIHAYHINEKHTF